MYSRSALTAPPYIRIRPSRIPGAGLGAFLTESVRAKTVLGEYTGQIMPASYDDADDKYIFTVHAKGNSKKVKCYITARNPRSRKTNWTRFINGVKEHQKHKQNCEFFQFAGRIWLRVCEDIEASSAYPRELLASYGSSYEL